MTARAAALAVTDRITALAAHAVTGLTAHAAAGEAAEFGLHELTSWMPDRNAGTAALLALELGADGHCEELRPEPQPGRGRRFQALRSPRPPLSPQEVPALQLHETCIRYHNLATQALHTAISTTPTAAFPTPERAGTWWWKKEDRLRWLATVARLARHDAAHQQLHTVITALGDQLGRHHRLLASLYDEPRDPAVRTAAAATLPVVPAQLALGAVSHAEHHHSLTDPAPTANALGEAGPGLAARARALAADGYAQLLHQPRPVVLAHCTRAVEMAEASGDLATTAICHTARSHVHRDPASSVKDLAVALAAMDRLDDPLGAALVQIGLSTQLRLARRELQAMEAAEAAIPPLRQRGLTLLEVEAFTAYLAAAVIAAPEQARQRLPAAVRTCHTVGLPAHADDLTRLVHRRFLG